MSQNLSQMRLLGVLTRLTVHRVLRRRSTLVLALVGLLPIMQGLFWLINYTDVFHANIRPFGLYLQLLSSFYATLFVPLLAIFLGLGVISDEIDSRNFTFTMTRPLSPLVIAGGRFLGHYLVALVILTVCVGAGFLSGMIFQLEDVIRKVPTLINSVFLLGGGMLAYMAVVAALGTTWRKFAILGSVIWLIFDMLFALFPIANLNAVSVRYRMLSSSMESLPQGIFTFAPIVKSSAFMHMAVFVLIAGLAVAYMTWYLKQFEIVLSGSEAG